MLHVVYTQEVYESALVSSILYIFLTSVKFMREKVVSCYLSVYFFDFQ